MRAKHLILLSLGMSIASLPVAVAPALAQVGNAVSTPPVIAPDQAPPPDPYGTLTFSTENDLFGGGTDRYYTNGFQFAWRSPSADLPRPLAWLNDQLDWVLGPGTLRWGLSFGQSIYTPEDTTRYNPDPRDRPYAGYLYGGVALNRTTELTSRSIELQLGVVGPSALGEWVQNNYHDIFNIRNTNGWDYQLKDEPAVTAIYDQKWRLPLGNIFGLQAEAIPSFTLSAGNVQTYAAAGGLVRVGQGLESDFGPPRIRPALAGTNWIQPERDFSWYVFAGVDGRAVARDIFLDGNTWRDSRSVDKRPFVGDFQVGAAVIWRGVRFALTQVWRSEEFYGQDGRQKFGSISVSFRF
jgi:lipid A 3-O-deacylase